MLRHMFRHMASYVVICFAPRFVPWPHTHDPIFRHVTTTPFITNGRIQAVLRGDSKPGPAERTAGPEAIGCPDPGNRAQRRSVIRARATGLRDDWLSGPDRTTDSGAIRSLNPIMLWQVAFRHRSPHGGLAILRLQIPAVRGHRSPHEEVRGDSRSESGRWVRRRFAILIRSSDRNLSKIRCLGGFRKPIPPSLPKFQRLGGIAPKCLR